MWTLSTALTGKPARGGLCARNRHEQRSKVMVVYPTIRGRWKKNRTALRTVGPPCI